MGDLTLRDYDFNESGRTAAARHCDRMRSFAEALDNCTGIEAVDLAMVALMENQTSVAFYAGLSSSRLSELKKRKRLTKAMKNSLIAGFCRRWIL